MLPIPLQLYIPFQFDLILQMKACHTWVWPWCLNWVQDSNLQKLLSDSEKWRVYLYLGSHDKKLTHIQILCKHSIRNKVA